jgi:proteasome lid subunit RPN8/RPN11
VVPVLCKTKDQVDWPAGETSAFLLASNGLWICRRHEFFESSVPARNWPAHLDAHQPFLDLHHPKIPRVLLESIVGFFDHIARCFAAEAGVLLVWNSTRQRIELLVPDQVAHVAVTSRGERLPIDLQYEIPAHLSPPLRIVGDVHSHVFWAAYSSAQDRRDEQFRPGLHVVVGRLDEEPPEFHVEYVVDGTRFEVSLDQIMEGYDARARYVSPSWLQKVKVRTCRES